MRLSYNEHRPNWTAASVYRTAAGRIQTFAGASERQAVTTTYNHLSNLGPRLVLLPDVESLLVQGGGQLREKVRALRI